MRLRQVCPECNTVVHVKRSACDCCHAFALKKRKARCTTVGEPENAMKRRKALLSEEELLVTKERDKVRKVSKRASETREQALHRQEQNRTHLACAKGSALQCGSLYMDILITQIASYLFLPNSLNKPLFKLIYLSNLNKQVTCSMYKQR